MPGQGVDQQLLAAGSRSFGGNPVEHEVVEIAGKALPRLAASSA